MKKKNLKNLRLKKAKVSNLNQQGVMGGTFRSICICPVPIPFPQQTVTGCSQFADCDSKEICTANICKTNELDTGTLPVC